VEGQETHVETALRELKEEANITLNPEDLFDCGMFLYTRYKDLHLYVAETDVDLDSLKCTTCFNFEGRNPLEVDSYKLIDASATQTYYRSLAPLVADCIKRYRERDINNV
jgi:8-oxo-dGTP pyrophosphatase MutT (NUDIX family)